ncbi:DUF4259 domain-containing protein [Streptomyces sp. NPDC051286]|uniref:DUF4259 domain-containing protein n=1 Tax=Streptomyces sp. NPDC051286 TaxID=3365647 RepID=UPI0037AED800
MRDAWVRDGSVRRPRHPVRSPDLSPLVVRALDRVLGEASELRELREDNEEWTAGITRLREVPAASAG